MKLPVKYIFLKVTTLILIFFCSCDKSDKSKEGWQMVFQNDANGQATFGDKSILVDAVRLGYPVRIGWGSSSVEHVAQADFLTIFDGKEVFAQINTIVGQAPQIQSDSLKIRFRTQNHWTQISGTNGFATSLMTNYFQDTIVSGDVDRYTTTRWYVLFPNHKLTLEAPPLWRENSSNWEKWNRKKE